MTPFETCVAALRDADTQTFFKALDAGLKATVGHKLFTLLYVAPNKKRVKRIYTNMPEAYPVGGYKEIEQTAWRIEIIDKGQSWVGYNARDIEWAFFDHKLIVSLGCESAMNIPVMYGGRVLGTMNLLDAENHYKASDPQKVLPFAALMVGPFLDAIAADPDIGK
jgi:hypothetical protein